jgi:hypothetical protein
MRKFILVAALAVSLSACTGSTEHGPCIGFDDDEAPGQVYKISIWNGFLAAFFSETLVVPVVWAFGYAKCPAGAQP